jgi:hypothetical protein
MCRNFYNICDSESQQLPVYVYSVTPEVYRNNLTAGSIAGLVGGLLFGLILLLLSALLCRSRRGQSIKKEGGLGPTFITILISGTGEPTSSGDNME